MYTLKCYNQLEGQGEVAKTVKHHSENSAIHIGWQLLNKYKSIFIHDEAGKQVFEFWNYELS